MADDLDVGCRGTKAESGTSNNGLVVNASRRCVQSVAEAESSSVGGDRCGNGGGAVGDGSWSGLNGHGGWSSVVDGDCWSSVMDCYCGWGSGNRWSRDGDLA